MIHRSHSAVYDQLANVGIQASSISTRTYYLFFFNLYNFKVDVFEGLKKILLLNSTNNNKQFVLGQAVNV